MLDEVQLKLTVYTRDQHSFSREPKTDFTFSLGFGAILIDSSLSEPVATRYKENGVDWGETEVFLDYEAKLGTQWINLPVMGPTRLRLRVDLGATGQGNGEVIRP